MVKVIKSGWLFCYLTIIFSFFLCDAHAFLNGTYTVNPGNPATSTNYRNIKSAVNDLCYSYRNDGGKPNGAGVSGKVTINIADGTYFEQLVFGSIKGASAANVVTFQSASKDSSKVKILYGSSSQWNDNNYTLYLDTTGYVNFNQLTFTTSGYIANNVVLYLFHCHNVRFTNNILQGNNNTNIASLSYTDSQTVFINNHFLNSYIAINANANSITRGKKIRLENNIIDSFYYQGISMQYEDSFYLVHNKIINGNGTGIYIYNCNYSWFLINANYLTSPLNISLSGPNKGPHALVSNNMVSLQVATSSISVAATFGSCYLDFINNSVLVYGALATGTSALSYSTNVNIYNNNVVNLAYGLCISTGSVTNDTINYNSYFTNGKNMAYFNSTYETNINFWKSATKMDANSYISLPWYKSNTDLHASFPAYANLGHFVKSVNSDFDGKPRNSPNVSIGANEYKLLKTDAGIFAIDSPSNIYCANTQNIYVAFANYGYDTLKSVKINWSVNGVSQTAYSWTGKMISGINTNPFNLGSYKFLPSTLYLIKVWTSGANTKIDSNATNDTLTLYTRASLFGNYTIGGTLPDFNTINAAMTALNTWGACGPVTFSIRNGTYFEQLVLDTFHRANPTSMVTFQSQSGDSSKVILQWNSNDGVNNSNKNYAIKVGSGAQYFTIKNITIIRPGFGTFRTVINMDFDSYHNSFLNNIIKNEPDNDLNNRVIVGGGSWLTISNNYLKGGYNGIELYTTEPEPKITISGNLIDSFYQRGITETGYDSLIIRNNLITNNISRNAYGIYFTIGSNTAINYLNTISGNKINLPQGGTGIYGYGQGTNPAIFNNFISVANVSSVNYCINTGQGANIYNNNFLIYGDTINKSYTLYSNTSLGFGSDTVYNNNFVNLAHGYSFYTPSTGKDLIDFNNYFTNGKNLAYWNTTTDANLAALQKSNAMDKHSISVNPEYSGNIDLHVHNAALDRNAKPVKGILFDIDGQLRNASNPDIGADEFSPLKTDAATIIIDTPSTVFCSGFNKIVVKIANFGSDTIKSLTIGWNVNNVSQTPFSWAGRLIPGGYADINIGTLSIKPNTSYNFKIWTSLPNSIADTNNINDTIRQSLSPGMSGNYSIGGAISDFNSFGQAINALKLRGVCGATIFNISDGTYRESPIIKTIPGAGPINTITFQSKSGDSSKVILENPMTTNEKYVLKLDSASWVNIKKITIQGLGINDSAVIKMVNSARITLVGNVIRGSTSCINDIDGTTMPRDSMITILGNHVTGGLYGISFYGYVPAALAAPQYNTKGWISVVNNAMDSIGSLVINFSRYDSVAIVGNLIQNLGSNQTEGIYIQNTSTTGTSTALISYNKINSGGSLVFVDLSGRHNSAVKIYNNFISGLNGNALFTQTRDSFYDIYDNNILTYGNNPGTQTMYMGFGLAKRGPGINFCGNNVINLAGGQVLFLSGQQVMKSENNNNFYTNGSVFGQIGSVSNIADFTSWKKFSSLDTNSVSVNPFYNSNTDLHVGNTALYQKGKVVSYINTDIDGRIRSAKPTIGAHEFHPINNDAGISAIDSPYHSFCGNSANIKVTLYNYGILDIKTATINWQVNGVTQKKYLWTGDLATSKTDTINLGIITFNNTKNNSIKAWAELPNGIKDGDSTNDTSVVVNLSSALGGSYTIGGKSPDYPNFTTAIADLTAKGLCTSVIFNVRDSVYKESLSIGLIRGASPKNTITFQSEKGDSSKAIISSSTLSSVVSAYPTIDFHGAQYVILNKLTINKTGSASDAYGLVMTFSKAASYNKVTHCQFFGVTTSNTPFSLLSEGNDNNCNGNVIDQNLFKYGFAGIRWYTSSADSDNVFSNNIIDSIYTYGIDMSYTNGARIINNRIGHFTNLSTFGGTGIRMLYCNNTRQISGNKIDINAGTTCLYINGCSGIPGRKALIANNYFSSASKYVYNYGGGCITIASSSYMDIVANSMNYYGSDSTNPAINFISNGNQSKSFTLVDNTCSSTSKGQIIQITTGGTYPQAFNSIAYNNWFPAPNTPFFGTYGGKAYATLKDWKLGVNKDSNSISLNPGYKTNSNLDLLSQNLFHKGIQLSNVKNDIYGIIRDIANPTIGGYEIQMYSNDVGAIGLIVPSVSTCGDSFTSIMVKFQNYGSFSQTKIPITIDVTGPTKITLNDTAIGIFLPGKTDSLLFKVKLNSYQGGLYNFAIHTALQGDQNINNDTVKFSLKFYEHAIPIFSFNSAACPADTVKFNDYSTISSGDNIASWFWNFGDGTTSILKNVSHLYSKQGSYQAILKITTNLGCTSQTTQTIQVASPPPHPRIKGDSVTCSGTTDVLRIAYSKGNSYNWASIPAGLISTDTLINIYPVVDTKYIITVSQIGSSCKSYDTFSVKALTLTNPKIAGYLPICIDSSAYKYSVGLNTGSRYVWQIKTGKILSGSQTNNIAVQWPDTGTGYLFIQETNASGCVDSDSRVIKISKLPGKLFSVTNTCLQDLSQFSDSDLVGQNFKWYFGDGTLSSLKNPNHKFKTAGSFEVSEVVTNILGCKDSISNKIVINPIPIVRFKINQDTGRLFNFSESDSTYFSYAWDFGDGTNGGKPTMEHNYLSNYNGLNINLKVTTKLGCSLVLDSIINVKFKLGVMKDQGEDSFQIYPDPFSDHISIFSNLVSKTDFTFALYNALGKEVFSQNVLSRLPGAYTDNIKLDKVNLTPGIYFVYLSCNDRVITQKMICLRK